MSSLTTKASHPPALVSTPPPKPFVPQGSDHLAHWARLHNAAYVLNAPEEWFRQWEPHDTLVAPELFYNSITLRLPSIWGHRPIGDLVIVEPWTAPAAMPTHIGHRDLAAVGCGSPHDGADATYLVEIRCHTPEGAPVANVRLVHPESGESGVTSAQGKLSLRLAGHEGSEATLQVSGLPDGMVLADDSPRQPAWATPTTVA
mgnify:CR=1 FL=1